MKTDEFEVTVMNSLDPKSPDVFYTDLRYRDDSGPIPEDVAIALNRRLCATMHGGTSDELLVAARNDPALEEFDDTAILTVVKVPGHYARWAFIGHCPHEGPMLCGFLQGRD